MRSLAERQINFANRHNIQTVPNQRSNQHPQRGGKILLDIRGRRRLCITPKLAANVSDGSNASV
jgi:hypothetical protein